MFSEQGRLSKHILGVLSNPRVSPSLTSADTLEDNNPLDFVNLLHEDKWDNTVIKIVGQVSNKQSRVWYAWPCHISRVHAYLICPVKGICAPPFREASHTYVALIAGPAPSIPKKRSACLLMLDSLDGDARAAADKHTSSKGTMSLATAFTRNGLQC